MNEIIARMLQNGATIHSTAQDQWQLRLESISVDLDCKSAFGRWYIRSFTIDQERVYLQEAVNATNANTLDKLAATHMLAMLQALDALTNHKAPTPLSRQLVTAKPRVDGSSPGAAADNPPSPAPRRKARKNSK